jgi:uncharacterized protein YjaG (DUF416 family)
VTHVLDEEIEKLERRLAVLPAPLFATFFAYWAEKLFPLYLRFEAIHSWGNSKALRNGLDIVWRCLSSGSPNNEPRLIDKLQEIIPNGETFDAPDSTYAQDAVICVDSALRALTEGKTIDAAWVEFVLEPFTCSVSLAKTDMLSEEGVEADQWARLIISDPQMNAALEECDKVLRLLESKRTSKFDVEMLRSAAQTKACRAQDFFIRKDN